MESYCISCSSGIIWRPAPAIPPTVSRTNTFLDGLFHAGTYLFVPLGLIVALARWA